MLNLSSILNPTMESITSHIVTGTLPNGEIVKVERYLRHWDAYLRVSIDGIVWHDDIPTKEEQHSVNVLRDSAMENQSRNEELRRENVRWLGRTHLS
jgi:hypothetical protein